MYLRISGKLRDFVPFGYNMYVRLFLSSGKSIEQLLSLPDGQLDELFGCTESRHREPSSRRIELDALLPGYQDQNTISLDLMNRMKLHGMAEAFRESLAGTTPQSMTADAFLSMLLAREWDYRAQAAIAYCLKSSRTGMNGNPSYCRQRWANPAWPKGSKSRGFSNKSFTFSTSILEAYNR